MRLFHRHDWALVDKTVVPGADGLKRVKTSDVEGTALMVRLALGYVVLVFRCTKPGCGRIRMEER